MNAYTILVGAFGLILLHSAWQEHRLDNRRDAWMPGFCGTGMGAPAGVFAVLL